jgi:hypothetical protein
VEIAGRRPACARFSGGVFENGLQLREQQEGLAMSKISGRNNSAILSIVTIGRVVRNTGAIAADEAEDQILRRRRPRSR